jgi:hypothetical protein
MRNIQQVVTWSGWPVVGGVGLVIFVLLEPRPALTSEAPPNPDIPSIEVPTQAERFQVSARDQAPPPRGPKCQLDGRPGSGARKQAALAWFRDLSRRDRQTAGEICSMEANQACLALMPEKGSIQRDPEEQREYEKYVAEMLREERRELKRLTEKFPEIERDCVADYCAAMRSEARYCDTPLVVAFDAQPVTFTASRSTFAFQPDQPVSTQRRRGSRSISIMTARSRAAPSCSATPRACPMAPLQRMASSRSPRSTGIRTA